MKKVLSTIVLLSLLLSLLFILSCTTDSSEKSREESPAADRTAASEDGIPGWMEVDLADVRTGQTFKISDFKGKPILLESFAVWCPTCTKQQKNVKELHDEIGEAVVSISLDTDPNEDVSRVQEHLQQNGFDWWYAVSPPELTQALIDEFGIGIVNAPSAPVVLICEDLSFRMLGRGTKSADELMQEISKGC